MSLQNTVQTALAAAIISAGQTAGIQVKYDPTNFTQLTFGPTVDGNGNLIPGETLTYAGFTGSSSPYTLTGVTRGVEGGSATTHTINTPCFLGFATPDLLKANLLPISGGTLTGQLTGPGGNAFDDGAGNMSVDAGLNVGGNISPQSGVMFCGGAGLEIQLLGSQYFSTDSGTLIDDGVGNMTVNNDLYILSNLIMQGNGTINVNAGQIYDPGAGFVVYAGGNLKAAQFEFPSGANFADDAGGGVVFNGTQIQLAESGGTGGRISAYIVLDSDGTTNGVQLEDTNGNVLLWANNQLVFPDSSVQTTAFLGYAGSNLTGTVADARLTSNVVLKSTTDGTSPAHGTSTSVAGSTTAIFTNTEFNGSSGTTAYTVTDLVTILKAAGILKP